MAMLVPGLCSVDQAELVAVILWVEVTGLSGSFPFVIESDN